MRLHMQMLTLLCHLTTFSAKTISGCLQYRQQFLSTSKFVQLVQHHIHFMRMLYLGLICGCRCGDTAADNNRLGGAGLPDS